MAAKISCSKCNSLMIEGFVIDRIGHSGKAAEIWVEGKPESSLWAGLNTSDRETYHVQAFRCAVCNHLDFFTTDRIFI